MLETPHRVTNGQKRLIVEEGLIAKAGRIGDICKTATERRRNYNPEVEELFPGRPILVASVNLILGIRDLAHDK